MITLYTTQCPKCNVLKRKLDTKGVQYTENTSVEEMALLGIVHVPVLQIETDLLDFAEANIWVNQQ